MEEIKEDTHKKGKISHVHENKLLNNWWVDKDNGILFSHKKTESLSLVTIWR
jgi:hypothetical protein